MAIQVRPLHDTSAAKVATLVAAPGTVVTQVPGEIVKTTDSPVTLRQKIAGYYKGVIGLVGIALMVANQVAPIVPADYQKQVTAILATLTVAGIILKENQHWFDDSVVTT